MKAARRGQLPLRALTTSSISTIRAGGNAPGNDEVARAANASPAALSSSKSLSTFPSGRRPVREMQDMAMLQFFDQRRIMDLQQLRMALVIGRRYEQIE